MSPNARGALMMMASMLSFTLNDVCVKATGGEVPLFQMIFLRGLGTTLLIGAFCAWMGVLSPRLGRRDWTLLSVRVASELLIVCAFLTALLNMPIANVTAVLQALPLLIAFAGAVIFKERVGWRRITAILVGFVGVLLIIRPGTADFTIYTVYALIAAGGVVVRDLVTRPMSDDVPSMFVAFTTAIGITIGCGLLSLFEPWEAVSSVNALRITGSAIAIIGGYLFSVLAIRSGELSFTALFRYTGILWALLLGWLVFAEWPDELTLVGVVLVVAAGVFTLLRERQAR
ncbi:DMT family transporter [Pseudaestuariivita sp.]|uniref:DMT family transporter n=1 Tax=Pseudaestuariivita sp. TaxID=2211669 RepID=UPI004059029A